MERVIHIYKIMNNLSKRFMIISGFTYYSEFSGETESQDKKLHASNFRPVNAIAPFRI